MGPFLALSCSCSVLWLLCASSVCNLLRHGALLSLRPSLDWSYFCQPTPTCVQVTSAPQHLETISNCPIAPPPSPSPFLLPSLHLLHPLFPSYFTSVFIFNSVSLPFGSRFYLLCVLVWPQPCVHLSSRVCSHFFPLSSSALRK